MSVIACSNPVINRLAISRKKTPDLQAGSRKVVLGLLNSSCGSKSNILFATSGGVKTSSLERLAKHSKMSGLYVL
jgi:hypothetical protein